MKFHKKLLSIAICFPIFSLCACSPSSSATPDIKATNESSIHDSNALGTQPNSSEITSEDIPPVEIYISSLIDQILSSDFSQVYANASSDVQAATTEADLLNTWQSIIADFGNFVAKDAFVSEESDPFIITQTSLNFENGGISIVLSLNDSLTIEGINFVPYQPQSNQVLALPETLTETNYTVTTGNYELPALLTSTEDSTQKSVLLLVHGSGPNNMNASAYGVAPFRDIAWGVASYGIDTFRYDKRTYVYQSNLTEKGDAYLTVEEEVIQDALSAAQLLSDKGYENIYLLGHSLGGMLGPRIINENPELFAGFISLAGTPRTLTEVQISQNEAVLNTLGIVQRKQTEAIITAEKEKYARLNHMTDEELLSQTIFGIPAYYVKDLHAYDTLSLTHTLDLPMLFLQGSDDFQVTVAEDFNLWQEGLADEPNASFKLYEGLTHMFTPSPANPTYTINDYQAINYVADVVIQDIADFILSH